LPERPVEQHAFNRASGATLERALAISNQRGGEYLDSWHVDNQVTTFLNHVLALPMVPGHEREYKRLLMVAALCDAKDSRMSGPWKADTIDDGINYRGAFAAWREEYEGFLCARYNDDPAVPDSLTVHLNGTATSTYPTALEVLAWS